MLLFPCCVHAGCIVLTSHPDDRPVASMPLPPDGAEFTIAYVHSVTRTPVTERYRIAGTEIVETELFFEQYGPGLPTEADAGGSFTRRDGGFVVTMDRHFPGIVMRVHEDQSPRLESGIQSLDLAQWGNRSLTLGVTDGRCAGP
jgi:hypothetical protein